MSKHRPKLSKEDFQAQFHGQEHHIDDGTHHRREWYEGERPKTGKRMDMKELRNKLHHHRHGHG